VHTTGAAGQLRDEALHTVADALAAMETSTLPRSVRGLLETDLTVQQLKVLTVLLTAPTGTSVRELAGVLGVSMASVSVMVDRLVAQGVARRVVDEDDLRVRRVHVTEEGQGVVRRMVGARPEFSQDILGRLTTEDLGALAQGLRAVAAAFNPDEVPGR
jgi:DNA-binding MarR family transcriptional regulator